MMMRVCMLVLAAADTTRSVSQTILPVALPSVTQVCLETPRIAHSHVAVSTDGPRGCRPGHRSWGVTFC